MENEPRDRAPAKGGLALGLWALGMTAATTRSAWPPSAPMAQVDPAREDLPCRHPWRHLCARSPA